MISSSAITKLRMLLRRALHPADLGFRRTSPVSAKWGFDRGKPVDRHYIESFLEAHRADIRGHLLEIKNSDYAKQFGADVTRFDVLDIDAANQHATLIADLSAPHGIPTNAFDCFLLTQTLHLIFDIQSAIHNAYQLLRPNGVLLATVPAVSKIDPDSPEDSWRFTAASCSRLFGDVFGPENITVTSYGNVLTCCAFLQGLAAEELSASELAVNDPAFPLILAIRAQKKS